MATFLPEALKRFKENYPDFKPDNVRLIDANALIEVLRKQGSLANLPISIIESAPTVETMDDVMARLTQDGRTITISPWSTGFGVEGYGKFADGNTLLEALKKLEASLNTK